MVVKNGDEFHGIESVKPPKQTQEMFEHLVHRTHVFLPLALVSFIPLEANPSLQTTSS